MFTRRVAIVEDEPLLAALLVDALRHAGYEARSAGGAAAATALIDEFDPDLVLLDIDLGPGPSGLDLGHALAQRRPDVAQLYLTRLTDGRAAGGPHTAPPAAAGYVVKDSVRLVDDLLGAITLVLRDDDRRPRQHLLPDRPLARLTDTQHDVLRLAALGLSNRAIAERRGTSEGAVEAALSAVFRALDIVADPAVNQRTVAVTRYLEANGRPMATPVSPV